MAKEKKRYEDLNQLVKDLVLDAGAIDVGIVTTETLKGGPPSTDLSYVLAGAKSAVVFALPLDQEAIDRFLKKEDHQGRKAGQKEGYFQDHHGQEHTAHGRGAYGQKVPQYGGPEFLLGG